MYQSQAKMIQDSDKETDILIVYSNIEIEITDDPSAGITPPDWNSETDT